MRFVIDLAVVPATGNELAVHIQRALKNVEYNIGPEPLRVTRGPIYSDDKATERIGTWSIEL